MVTSALCVVLLCTGGVGLRENMDVCFCKCCVSFELQCHDGVRLLGAMLCVPTFVAHRLVDKHCCVLFGLMHASLPPQPMFAP